MTRISELQEVSNKYVFWMTEIGFKRSKGEFPDITESLNKVYGPYLKKRDELLADLGKYASENF